MRFQNLIGAKGLGNLRGNLAGDGYGDDYQPTDVSTVTAGDQWATTVGSTGIQAGNTSWDGVFPMSSGAPGARSTTQAGAPSTPDSMGVDGGTVNLIKTLLLTGQQFMAQDAMQKVNLERAQRGLSPLPMNYFTPQAGVQVGIAPGTQDAIVKAGMWGIGLFALSAMFGGSRGKGGGARRRRR